MGLNTTHDCWDGAYSAFMRWRTKLAEAAGLPPLGLMEGFYVPLGTESMSCGAATFFDYERAVGEKGPDPENKGYRWSTKELDKRLPISWDCLKPDPLYELLYHSDCEGEIPWKSCGPMADSLEKLIPELPDDDGGGHIGNWREKTQTFVDGLREAFAAKENVGFH